MSAFQFKAMMIAAEAASAMVSAAQATDLNTYLVSV